MYTGDIYIVLGERNGI